MLVAEVWFIFPVRFPAVFSSWSPAASPQPYEAPTSAILRCCRVITACHWQRRLPSSLIIAPLQERVSIEVFCQVPSFF
jgi:hypothetical protein